MAGENFVESLQDLRYKLNNFEFWDEYDRVRFSNLIDWLVRKENEKVKTGQLYFTF